MISVFHLPFRKESRKNIVYSWRKVKIEQKLTAENAEIHRYNKNKKQETHKKSTKKCKCATISKYAQMHLMDGACWM